MMRRTMLLALPAAALVLAGCAGSPATPEEAVAIEKKAMSEGIDRQMMPLYFASVGSVSVAGFRLSGSK